MRDKLSAKKELSEMREHCWRPPGVASLHPGYEHIYYF